MDIAYPRWVDCYPLWDPDYGQGNLPRSVPGHTLLCVMDLIPGCLVGDYAYAVLYVVMRCTRWYGCVGTVVVPVVEYVPVVPLQLCRVFYRRRRR